MFVILASVPVMMGVIFGLVIVTVVMMHGFTMRLR